MSALSSSDLAMFERLGIPPELLQAAQITRVTDRESRELLSLNGRAGDMAGIHFPYFRLQHNGDAPQRLGSRVRRDHPEMEGGKARDKYLSSYGDRRHLYFAPGAAELLADNSLPVVLVEAEKSALALTAWAERMGRKILAVGMGGCWGWRGRIGIVDGPNGERLPEKGPLPDLDYLNGREIIVLLDSNTASNPKVRQARAALVRELQRRKCKVRVAELPQIQGINGPDDYIGFQGDQAMARVLEDVAEPRETEYADDDLALRFSAKYADSLRYTARWGQWREWDGRRWREDDTVHIYDLVRGVCREASAELDEKQRATKTRLKAAQTISGVERLARCDRRHAALVADWDSHPWLLNTPAGVIDLRTGELRPHQREGYFTKITAVAPGEKCPQWLAFLKRVTDGDRELEAFLQRMAGYALTGSTGDEALFFLYGTGANGKSKFLGAMSGLLGDYATTAPMETFMATKGEQHPTDLASLQGARLVTAIETDSGRNWAESKIKNLTGGDRIAARFMRQDFFQFTPEFKLLIAGNHKPSLRSVDEAIRRRLHLVPFTVTIPEGERDLNLAEKLRAEWSGILRWAVEGCLAWQREGLNPPAVVRAATAEYMTEEDTFGQWVEEHCTLSPRCTGKSSAMYGTPTTRNGARRARRNVYHREDFPRS